MAFLTPEFLVSNLAASLKFYVDDLGFEILHDQSEEKFAELKFEDVSLMLEEIGSGFEWLTGKMELPFGRGMNLKIIMADVTKLYEKLKSGGHNFYLGLEEKWWRKKTVEIGNLQFMIQDPDGYLLRFAQDLGSRPATPITANT